MGNEIIKLLHETKTRNGTGDPVVTTEERIVFARVQSITQSEFYQAQAAGYKPELKFVLADFLDYQGEMYLSYQGYAEPEASVYKVIRTYRTVNALEITAQKGVEE